MSGFWICPECGAEMYGFENCQYCGACNFGGQMTIYEKLFGSPEKAADTLACACMGAGEEICYSCPFKECDGRLRRHGSFGFIEAQMLEWLRARVDI